MTAKRFYVAESNLIDGYCVFDREKKYIFTPRPRKADCLNDVHILNALHKENKHLKKRLNNVERELFCKDRILEEKGTDIECCDEKGCGHCKHCQLDGMFGMWCDIHDDIFFHNVSVCSDFER